MILAVKVGIAIGLITWLLRSGRLELSRLASVRLNWQLAALFATIACSMAVPALRWWWLLRIQRLPESLATVVKLTWVGYLTALVLPGAASGDLSKSYLIMQHNQHARARAVSTVLADRFLGLYSLLIQGAISAVWMIHRHGSDSVLRGLIIATLIPLVTSTAGIAALLYPATRAILLRVLPANWRDSWQKSFAFYVNGWPQLAGCFALSIANAALTSAVFVVAARSLGQSIAWDSAFLVGPLVVIANCLPIAPGGIGVAESVSSELFGRIGTLYGAEVMALGRICTGVLSLAGLVGVLGRIRNGQQVSRPDLDPIETIPVPSTIFSAGGK